MEKTTEAGGRWIVKVDCEMWLAGKLPGSCVTIIY
jgi:hypothetical protein